MDIGTIRDYIIIILGSLMIILTIGILVVLTFVFVKIGKLLRSVDNSLRPISKTLAYIVGLFKGFNESVNIFGKGE